MGLDLKDYMQMGLTSFWAILPYKLGYFFAKGVFIVVSYVNHFGPWWDYIIWASLFSGVQLPVHVGRI